MKIYEDFVFPHFYDYVVNHKIFDSARAELLKNVSGRVLEIGIGTGQNLDLYPKEITELTALDPNPGMERELKKKLVGKALKVDFRLQKAETLPFEDATYDTVVSTLTMCTIPELQKALAEVKRVLKRNGKLVFMEHGRSSEPRVAKLQKILNPLQNVIGCGCKLNVEIESELKAAGFRIESMKKGYLEGYPKILSYLYQGVARN